MNKLYLLRKTAIMLFFFIVSLIYESASTERMALLIFIFIVFLSWGFIRPLISNKFYFFYIDGMLLLFLEYESKFVINYFLHILFIFILFEVAFSLKKKNINKTIIPLIVMALMKFAYLLIYQLNARSISEFLFNLFALLFFLTLIHYTLLQREEKQTNHILYQELLTTHRQLKELMKQSEENATLLERNRIARDIHDTVGHQLTSLIMQLEMMELTIQKSKSTINEFLTLVKQTKDTARQCLTETRNAVFALQDKKGTGLLAIKELVEHFQRDTRIQVHLELIEQEASFYLLPQQSYTLYRIIQESLTNAGKHNDATQINIILEIHHNLLQFKIFNPTAKNQFNEGFGLKNMESRVTEIGGIINFSIDEGKFNIFGYIPIGKEPKHKHD